MAPTHVLATVAEACGPEPGWLCRSLFELTDNARLAGFVDRVLVTPLHVLLIVVVAFVVHRVLRRWVTHFVGRMEGEIQRRVERARELGTRSGSRRAQTRRFQRLHAIGGALGSAVGIVVWIVAALLVLGTLDVNLAPLLAGAGLAGLVIGFGAQNVIRDWLAGFHMLIEDQYGVGDWVEVDDAVGEVEHVGLRVTRLRDINGVVWHVPNGLVQKVGNLSQGWARATLDVPVALDTDVARAKAVIQEVADGLAREPGWSDDIIAPPELWGMQSWGPEGVSQRLVIPTRPLRNWDVSRQLRERLKARFEAEGIRMPVPQREVGSQRWGEPVRHADVPAQWRPPPARDRTHDGGSGRQPAETTGEIRIERGPAPRPD